MFIEDIHREFRILMDKSYSNSYPEIEVLEIDSQLNNTLLAFIHNRYGLNNFYQKGFEQSQKRTDDLRTLVKTSYFIPTSQVTEGDYKIVTIELKYPFTNGNGTIESKQKYMHYLKGIINATYSRTDSCGNITNTQGITTLKIVNQEEVDKLIFDPFNKPTVSNCFGVFESDKLLIYIPSTDYTINSVKITYLKVPNIIRHVSNPVVLTTVNILTTYTYYEVLSENVIYEGKSYKVGDWFETNLTTFITGGGSIRLFTGVELPDYMIRELIKESVKNYLELLESPRQQTIERVVSKEE